MTGSGSTQTSTMGDPNFDLVPAITPYSGTDKDYKIAQFVAQIDDYKSIGNWNDATTCTIARRKLIGKAAAIVSADSAMTSADVWKDLKKLLLERFAPVVSMRIATKAFVSCTQKPDEKVDDFALRLSELADAALQTSSDASIAAVLKTAHEGNKLIYFIEGLRPNIRDQVRLANPTSFAAAVKVARKQEAECPEDVDHSILVTSAAAATTTTTGESTAEKLDQIISAMTTLSQRQDALAAKVEAISHPAVEDVCVLSARPRSGPKPVGEAMAVVPYGQTSPAATGAIPQQLINELGQAIAQAVIAGLGPNLMQRRGQRRNQRARVTCFNCNKQGHYQRDCWSPRDQEKNKKQSSQNGKDKQPEN